MVKSIGRGPLGGETNSPNIDTGTLARNQTQPPGSIDWINKTQDLLGHNVMLVEDPGYSSQYEKVIKLISKSIDSILPSKDPAYCKAFKGELSEGQLTQQVKWITDRSFDYLKVERNTRDTAVVRNAEHYMFTLAEYNHSSFQQQILVLKSDVYTNILKQTKLGRHIAGSIAGDGWNKPASKPGEYEHHFNIAGSIDRFKIKVLIKEKIMEAGKQHLLDKEKRNLKNK